MSAQDAFQEAPLTCERCGSQQFSGLVMQVDEQPVGDMVRVTPVADMRCARCGAVNEKRGVPSTVGPMASPRDR